MADSGHYSIDSTTVRAHVSAAGRAVASAAKGGLTRRALVRSRVGFTSKLHCLADARGRPLAFHLTVCEAADCKAYHSLAALPEQAPRALLTDKGYNADAIRTDLARRNIQAVTRAVQTAGSESNMTGRYTGSETTSNSSSAV